MKAIILARVSTQIQDYQAQTSDLIEFAKSKGYTELHIIETKETGLADLVNKLGANEMVRFYEQNPDYNTVFSTELARLGRRGFVLHYFKDWFVKNKIQFYLKDNNYSLLENDGSLSFGGEMLFNHYAMFAEQELKAKKDRFKRSKTFLLEHGYSHAGKTLFGYIKAISDLPKKNTLVEDETNADIVRTIYNWYLNGIENKTKNPSIKTITLECIKRGFPNYTHSKRNVNKLLKEEGYTGFKITNNKRKNPSYNGEKNEDEYIVTNFKIKYPQIIDRETFDMVQHKLLLNNTNAEKSYKHTTLLAKLIKCDYCNSHFNANYRFVNSQNKSTYRCSSHSSANPCDNKQTISMSMIDSAIWNFIKTDLELLAEQIKINDPDSIENNYKKHLEELLNKKKELQNEYNIELKSLEIIKRVKNANIGDFLLKFEKNTTKIDKELGRVDKEISKAQMLLNIKQNENNDVVNVINKNLARIETSKELLKDYINLFVESIRIIYHNNKYTILHVSLKNYSNVKKYYFPNSTDYIQYDDAELEPFNSILLDKSQTLSIKMFKSTKIFHPNGKNSIQIGRFTFLIPQMIEEIQNVKKFPILKEVNKVEFSKLAVY